MLYDGTRGPGKTDALLMDFAQHCGRGYGINWRGMLFRETFPQLKEVIHKSNKFFKQIFPKAEYNSSDHLWCWPDGEVLILSYMKDPKDYWNYHGHEYPWIGWEELCNWKDDQCYELMKACNRSSHPGMPRRYMSTTNPYGKGHNWVKAWFIDPAPANTPILGKPGWVRCRIQGFLMENRHLVENDPEYVDTIRNIKDPMLRKAWWEGSWDIVAGGALSDVWNENIHIVKPFVVSPYWKVDRSFDWGSSKPFSVGWWAESDGSSVEIVQTDGKRVERFFPKGTIFRIHEWYGWDGNPNKGCKMLSRDIARGIKEIEERWDFEVEPGPAGSDIFDGEDGMSIADKMADEGVEWTRADTRPGSRIAGLERVRQMLWNAQQQPMEDPGIFIVDRCLHWKRTVPTLPRDEKKIDDVDTETEDHIYDETRYRASEVSYEEGTVALSGH